MINQHMLESKRLILRKWHENDAEALYRYASDDRVCRLALWPRHTSVGMSREIIRNVFVPNPYTFALVLKESDEPMGCMGLVPEGCEHYSPLQSEREAGYWIGYPYWGLGLATEALGLLIRYCRDRMDISSLLITADSRNIASQRVAEKCGFRLIDNYTNDGICSKAYRLYLRDSIMP